MKYQVQFDHRLPATLPTAIAQAANGDTIEIITPAASEDSAARFQAAAKQQLAELGKDVAVELVKQ